VERTPDSVRAFLTDEQFKLYDLIWKRAVASQTSSAIYDATPEQDPPGPCESLA
jgi:DNA topoisomerase-1